MYVAHPDPQAVRQHEKHKKRNLTADRLGTAKARQMVTFAHLADRGVISKDSLKRDSYMPR